ncbi:DNA polymerase delta catalytic subunit [Bonamia ostreae]|uniref:DNA polymerase delta catalytic subunit n=1 Tax=Bonamia ostreae TaxID=126728 RepID=A0ABV2ASX3_9EUKA
MASIHGGIKKFKANTNNWKRTPSTKINNKNFLMQLLDIDITLQNKKSIFRIYGVDNDGNSAVFYVHNFKNYFYVEIPSDWSKTEEEFAEGVITTLKNNLRTEFEVYTDIVEQKSILGYSFGQTLKFVQIFFSAFNLISSARNILYKVISKKI